MSQEGLRGSKGVAVTPFTAPPYVWANNAGASTMPASTTPFLDFELYSNSTTAPCRQGAVRVQCLRYVPMVTWDGNADCALRVYSFNGVAQPAGQRSVGMELQCRTNYSNTMVTGIASNTRVSSGATTPTMYGIYHRCEIYGTVSTTLYGMYLEMSNEGAASTTSAGILVHNSNASLATTIGSALRITKSAVNTGFDYLIDASTTDACNTAVMALYDDGTVCNDTNAQAITNCTTAGYITVVVGSATRYIWLGSNAPTA